MRSKIFKVLATLATVATLGACVAANYAKDLDSCVMQYAPDRRAILQCQCQVSQQYGRDCSWQNSDAGAE